MKHPQNHCKKRKTCKNNINIVCFVVFRCVCFCVASCLLCFLSLFVLFLFFCLCLLSFFAYEFVFSQNYDFQHVSRHRLSGCHKCTCYHHNIMTAKLKTQVLQQLNTQNVEISKIHEI